MNLQIRAVARADAEQIVAIYTPIVRETAISFELEPPSPAAMAARIDAYTAFAPWIVAERRGEILGYAYASKHRERVAYQWSVETSIYVLAGARRGGVARTLYGALFALLRAQGFFNAYAGITLPNGASVGFHESCAFKPIGVYKNIGYKFGAWHDVGWWSLDIQPHVPAPHPPLSMQELIRQPAWQEISVEASSNV